MNERLTVVIGGALLLLSVLFVNEGYPAADISGISIVVTGSETLSGIAAALPDTITDEPAQFVTSNTRGDLYVIISPAGGSDGTAGFLQGEVASVLVTRSQPQVQRKMYGISQVVGAGESVQLIYDLGGGQVVMIVHLV